MIHHISIGTNNFAQSLDFYDKTLAVLGYERLWNQDNDQKQEAGYGKNGKIRFLLFKKKNLSEKEQKEVVGQANGFHICFDGHNAEKIQQWHKKCIELGGKDNGKAGPRDLPGYYAAYIIDPNGWRTEACVFNPQ